MFHKRSHLPILSGSFTIIDTILPKILYYTSFTISSNKIISLLPREFSTSTISIKVTVVWNFCVSLRVIVSVSSGTLRNHLPCTRIRRDLVFYGGFSFLSVRTYCSWRFNETNVRRLRVSN